jgi:hypothetical protein
MKDSRMLNGIAYHKIPYGKTPRLPIVTHIMTNATNQDRKVVCMRVNFLAKIKIATANRSDHIPQTAPLIGADGKLSPRSW